jgi:hypothetical protein
VADILAGSGEWKPIANGLQKSIVRYADFKLLSINSNALQIGAYQDLVTKIIEVNHLLASNYELAELNRKGNEDPAP